MHPDKLVGRIFLDLWVDGDRERLGSFLAEVSATRGRVVGPVESVVETGDRRSTLECVGSNLMDDTAIGGLALNFRDVTERKALEEQLRSCLPRPADAAGQPQPVLEPRRARAGAGAPLAAARRGDVPRPRQLQERERHARSRRRRPAAAGGRAAAGEDHPPVGDCRAPGRRRVRHPAGGHPQRRTT